MGRRIRSWVALAAVAGTGLVVSPRAARASCGLYVAGHDQPLVNEATQVVLVRKGTRTVVTIQSAYQGPPEAFAMIIPVPVALAEQDVKTLPRELLQHVEQLGAPRLVEYWEQDPCAPQTELETTPPPASAPREPVRSEPGVKVETQFVAGEYQIAILSAKDSTGLEAWLRQEKYNLPQGAEPLLRSYVDSGMKLLVAKVDPKKVTFEAGRARLSPLRFHYDADSLALPIRIGLPSSSGTQDLVVNILAPGQRYEAANYRNVFVPTNIDVKPAIETELSSFYAALFDRTLDKNAGAIVTEYAWPVAACDPCTGPTLRPDELQALGADVLLGTREQPQRYDASDFVLTRLHARYGKDIAQDLVLAPAPPIAGGQEIPGPSGALEQDARPGSENMFQARYAIRHPWKGPIRCSNPRRGIWGGAPIEIARDPRFQAIGTKPALDLAFAPRDTVKLARAITHDVPALDVQAGTDEAVAPPPGPAPVPAGSGSGSGSVAKEKRKSGCGCQSTGAGDALGLGVVLGLGMLVRRRRRR